MIIKSSGRQIALISNWNIRRLSSVAQVQVKTDANDEQEWNNAKPYSTLPGPSKFEILRYFLPGGRYYKLTMIDMMKALNNDYGSLMKLPGILGKPDMVVTFDPKYSVIIFRNEGQWPVRRGIDTIDYYRKKIRPDIFKKSAGLTYDRGESWANLRTAANPIMMKPKLVRAYIPAVDTVVRDFIRRVKTIRDEKNEMPDDFHNELLKWSLESIVLIALEHRLGLLSETDNPENQKLINAITDFFKLAYELDVKPSIWRYYKTPTFNRLMECFDVMTTLTKKHTDRAIERLANQTGNNESQEESVLKNILQVDKDYAVILALDMLIAGIDTTSAAVSGLWYNLAKNQNAQDKLREEILTLLPDANAPLTPDSLNSMPYMRACLKESLRVSPVPARNIRCIDRDIVLRGYQIPKGTLCVMGSMTMAKDEKFVERADEFIPERFLKETQPGCPSAKDFNPFIFIPFGFGSRACIGRRFAEMEIGVLTMRLLREYKIEWNNEPMKYANGLILTPASKLKYKITEL
ncbi:probable cytochrome P450 12b2, mitochondrial [Bradysia coprophila]|uniref:probable cytochrome P450 12b2, mitochondrial n=1 Tax=Bradysia coprophila TaxID=38358 RepID=UPI00187DC41F|nr:probable cytochrome P450 12b2, mitochondrial [Bradysia coprophila]